MLKPDNLESFKTDLSLAFGTESEFGGLEGEDSIVSKAL